MSGFIHELSHVAASLIGEVATPLLIWTILALGVVLLLRTRERVHVLYHYQLRLACLIALPAGLVTVLLVELVAGVIAGPASAPLKLIILESPLELVLTEGAEEGIRFTALAYGVALLVYGAGLLFMLARLLAEWVQLWRLNRSLSLFKLETLTALSRENRRLAATCRSSVQIAFSSEGITPVTYGWFQPVILLPENLAADREKLNLVIRHELMHIRSGDYSVHLLASLIRAVFWFHPLVQIIYNQLVDYREMRCDSLVLSDLRVSKKAYASVLLELLPLPNLNRSVSVNMAQESSNLKKRIHKMKTENRENIPIKSSLSLFCGLTLTVTLLMSCTDIQQGPGEDGELSAHEQMLPQEMEGLQQSGDFFTVVEEMPELIGGLASVQESIEYPEPAKRAGIEGRVYIQFIVNEQGDVEDPRVIRGIGGGADEAALEAVSQAKFRPGRQRGTAVRVQYSLPVVFRLNPEPEAEP